MSFNYVASANIDIELAHCREGYLGVCCSITIYRCRPNIRLED